MSNPETHSLEEAAPAQASEPLKIPWEDPEAPRLAALLTTVWQLLIRPGEFFRLLSREGWQQSLSFGLIAGSFGLLATFYTEMLLSLSLSQRLESLPILSQLMAQTTGLWVILMLLTPFLISVSLLLGTLSLWAVLRLQGLPATLSLALKINGYSQAGLVVAAVPVLGALAAAFWNLYLTYKGVREMFGLSWWRSWGSVMLALTLEGLALGLGLAAATLPFLLGRLP